MIYCNRLRFFLAVLFGTFVVVASMVCRDAHKSVWLDTAFLKRPEAVRKRLRAEGFKQLFFQSTDKLKLDALFLQRPNATCNVILCAGWLPGRKEGMASFYTLLPPTCNILMFDARGHGRSEGPLLRNLWSYGVDEYNDVIGALDFVRSKNALPTVIVGLCAGAFNAAHALIVLHRQGRLDCYDVRGLVFDSGWASVDAVSRTALPTAACEFVRSRLCRLTGQKNDRTGADDSAVVRTALAGVQSLYRLGHGMVYAPFEQKNERKTNLFDKIGELPLPLLFIHASDDQYVAIEDTRRLCAAAQRPKEWWIETPSKHACHHLKYTDAYRMQLCGFMHQVLDKPMLHTCNG